jgi:hypothetical protein
MVAQAMIEEVALPIHAVFSGYIFLPVFDHRGHSRLARQGQDGVQVIRHKQTKAAMPEELLVIVFHRCQHAIADVGAAQLVFTPGHTIDGDEKPTTLGDQLRNCVRQLLADGQIHVGSLTKSRNQLSTKVRLGRRESSASLRAALRVREHGAHFRARRARFPTACTFSERGLN